MVGTARLTRSYTRSSRLSTVRQIRRSRYFQRNWSGPNVVYVVATGDAWSAYLRRMTSRTDWSVARLAREAGIARSTIFRWIKEGADGSSGLTIQSVYAIADALGDDRASALTAAGNLPPERDAEVELILGSDRSDDEKAAMIDRLMRRREEDKARRMDDLRFVLGDGTVVVVQAKTGTGEDRPARQREREESEKHPEREAS